jgi:hypothetical protein
MIQFVLLLILFVLQVELEELQFVIKVFHYHVFVVKYSMIFSRLDLLEKKKDKNQFIIEKKFRL